MPTKPQHGKSTLAVKRKCCCDLCAAYRRELSRKSIEWRKANSERYEENRKNWWAKLDPDIKSEYGKRWYRKNKDKKLAIHKEWYWKHRDEECKKNRERARNRYRENSQEIKIRVRNWRKENMDKVNEIAQRRRARKQGQLGEVPSNIVDILWQFQKGLCFYCGRDLKILGFHREHMIPLSRGGYHDKANLCLSCPPCNLRKNNKTAQEFLEEI